MTVRADDGAAWVAALAEKHKPGSVQLNLIAFRLLLDFVGSEPNPARDRRVKLPKLCARSRARRRPST